jgi:hypothetical protein
MSTGIMPIVGVRIYDALGSTLRAFQITFIIIAILRVFTTALWTLRWWLLRKEPK